jgi:hypothetical protein
MSLVYSHNKWNKSDLFITGHNTKLFELCFTHIGVLIFNKLYSEIKNTEPMMKFKKILSYSFIHSFSIYSFTGIT